MNESLSVLLIVLALVNACFLAILAFRKPKDSSAELNEEFSRLGDAQKRIEQTVKEEIARNRDEMSLGARKDREELSASINTFADSQAKRVVEMGNAQKNQLDSFTKQLGGLTDRTEQRLEAMRTTMERKLSALQDDNTKKLDQMRQVVDEKLHNTLETRLGEAFNTVVQRLEQVHQGLGEMRSLRSEEHTSELQSPCNLVCRLLLEKK